jgi:hypothetical protein
MTRRYNQQDPLNMVNIGQQQLDIWTEAMYRSCTLFVLCGPHVGRGHWLSIGRSNIICDESLTREL